MSSPRQQASLIDELDARQNDVLDRLAELNARVETLLRSCLELRETSAEELAASEPGSDNQRPFNPAGPTAPICQSPAAAETPPEC